MIGPALLKRPIFVRVSLQSDKNVSRETLQTVARRSRLWRAGAEAIDRSHCSEGAGDVPLPKLADRTFILGAFLPTLLFFLVLLFEFHDHWLAKEWIATMTSSDRLLTCSLLFGWLRS
jgi:hypothetical protein